MPDKRKFLLCAGIPANLVMATTVTEDTDARSTHIEEEIDDLIDSIDGSRCCKCIWAVFDLNICDIATACERFGKMMASHPTAFRSENVQAKA